MMKYKSISVSSAALSRFLESIKETDAIVLLIDPQTQEVVCVMIGYLFGIRGYCVPVTHPQDQRDILVHHITYYHDIDELLTHSHSIVRAEGQYWFEQEKEVEQC